MINISMVKPIKKDIKSKIIDKKIYSYCANKYNVIECI